MSPLEASYAQRGRTTEQLEQFGTRYTWQAVQHHQLRLFLKQSDYSQGNKPSFVQHKQVLLETSSLASVLAQSFEESGRSDALPHFCATGKKKHFLSWAFMISQGQNYTGKRNKIILVYTLSSIAL